jgi:hypothetical protein
MRIPQRAAFALLYIIFPSVYVCRGSRGGESNLLEDVNNGTLVKSLHFKWRFAPEITLAKRRLSFLYQRITFRIDTASIHERYLVVTMSQVQLIVVESSVPKRPSLRCPANVAAQHLVSTRVASHLLNSPIYIHVQLDLDTCNISISLGQLPDTSYNPLMNFCDGH